MPGPTEVAAGQRIQSSSSVWGKMGGGFGSKLGKTVRSSLIRAKTNVIGAPKRLVASLPNGSDASISLNDISITSLADEIDQFKLEDRKQGQVGLDAASRKRDATSVVTPKSVLPVLSANAPHSGNKSIHNNIVVDSNDGNKGIRKEGLSIDLERHAAAAGVAETTVGKSSRETIIAAPVTVTRVEVAKATTATITANDQTGLVQAHLGSSSSSSSSESIDKVKVFSMADFEQIRAIGSGSYGCVTLCRHRATNTPCVVKAVNKAHAFVKHEQQHVLNEKQVLTQLTQTDCPFSAKVYGYFQDDTDLYFVLEYVPGGELFSYMVQYDRFDDKGASFFVAQLALVLEHMHSQGIIYRDVKPENMLVDETGYIKVCDFGFSRHVARGDRAYSMCGTPEYIAPEVLRGKGHGMAVDLWSLGIFTYELLVGRTPFEGNCSRATHVNILTGSVKFPDWVSQSARDFITSLLVSDETQRLGNGPDGFAAIFGHPWLAGVDLDALRRRELPSPIAVKVSSLFDSRNFDGVPPDALSSARGEMYNSRLNSEIDEFFAGFDGVTRELTPLSDICGLPIQTVWAEARALQVGVL